MRSRKDFIRSAARHDDHEKHDDSRRRGLRDPCRYPRSGEEAFATLTKFVDGAGITAASLTAIGAFEKATIGWFDIDKKSYKKIEVAEQCEVLSDWRRRRWR